MTTKERTLNPRQLAFARNYVDTGNASESYRAAGYSELGADGSASRLLVNASIQAEIARLKAVPVRTSASRQAYVLDNLHELAANGTPDSARIRATELLGKHEKMFVDVSESVVTHTHVALVSMPLDELLSLRDAWQQQPQAAIEDVVVESVIE